jgi:hypothetical protein
MIAAMMRRGHGWGGGPLLGLLACACVTSTPAAALPASSEEIVRTYTGAITAATGHYAHAHARLAIRLTLTTGEPFESSDVPLRSSAHYRLSIVVRGADCRRQHNRGPRHPCLALRGTLRGEGRDEEEHLPDTGGSVRFAAASARVDPLGAVAAKCVIRGVGFIARRGRRSLSMQIIGKAGTVWIAANGKPVPPFTPP